MFDAETHRLSVDTYAPQHPGELSPRVIQSVCAHLVVCRTLEHGWTVPEIRSVMGRMSKGVFFGPRWLSPNPAGYQLRIFDLLDALTSERDRERVRRWARST